MTDNKKTILIAEDEDSIRFLMSLITQENFPQTNVESFEDGNSLEKRLNNGIENVKVIVTDNNMPGINGSTIVEKYAKRPEYSGVKFILHYGGDLGETGETAMRNGAFAYLLKPMNLDKYTNTVKRALGL